MVEFIKNNLATLLTGVVVAIGIAVWQNRTSKKRSEEDRILSVKPYITYTKIKNINKRTELAIRYEDDDSNKFVNAYFLLRNIGAGPLIDFDIDGCYLNDEIVAVSIAQFGSIDKGEQILLLIDLGLKVDNGKPRELSFDITYKDSLNNKYRQYVKVPIIMRPNHNLNEFDPTITEIREEEPEIIEW